MIDIRNDWRLQVCKKKNVEQEYMWGFSLDWLLHHILQVRIIIYGFTASYRFMRIPPDMLRNYALSESQC